MKTQHCPNCGTAHDVGIFVSGQKVLCNRCGIRFEIKRNDASPSMTPRPPKPGHSGSMPTAVERPREPTSPPVPEPAPGVPLGVAAPRAEPNLYFDKTAIRGPGQATPPPQGQEGSVEVASAAAAAGPAPIPLSVPLVIPGFELQEILGRGGMGEVWKARQVSLGRTVAIKLLPPKLAQDAEFVARFEKEATALASLSHPNIIQIIDRGVAGDHYYFVMELVEGRSLREVMQASRLSAADALKIVAQICRAIDYAHEKHIIHRDLKPENILVDARGHVKVADFGLAGFRGHDSEKQHLTATAVAMGTLNYMAPEQRKDAKSVDGRADLYSLGVILYELLTGELPLGRFKLPSEKLAGLDLRVDEIVVKSLEPDPEQRYQRASVIGAALESIIPTSAVGISGLQPAAGQPSGVTPQPATSQTARTGSFVERGWPWVRSALAVVGGLAVLAVVVLAPNIRGLLGAEDAHAGGPREKHLHHHEGEKYPNNTEGRLYARASAGGGDKKLSLSTAFSPATQKDGEPFNAHDGEWELDSGRLEATQAGSIPSDGKKIRPRAVLEERYFSSDDFTAEVEMAYQGVDDQFALEPDDQRTMELAFRTRDINIAVWALPGKEIRLMWKYLTADGVDQAGNSARDPDLEMNDEVPTPGERTPFRVQLSLKRLKQGTQVEARMNGTRVARKFLPGLTDATGRLALGCHNLHCEFDDLTVQGLPKPKPERGPDAGSVPAP
ncbi:MAG TPA: serine/threonine-protein kinase [Myxococcaceae bacterium]|jgi:serine/threonine-protein kinase